MAFGNMGDDCGTGVAFTRDPATGENGLFGEFLTNAQGEDVVAGVRTPMHISEMEQKFPEAFAQFKDCLLYTSQDGCFVCNDAGNSDGIETRR